MRIIHVVFALFSGTGVLASAQIQPGPSVPADNAERERKSSPAVTVTGEVKNPGTKVKWHKELQLYAAIAGAGGFTEFADVGQVKLTRGKIDRRYNLRKISTGENNNPSLLDGDIIHVPKRETAPVEPDPPAAPKAPETSKPVSPHNVEAEPRPSPAVTVTGEVKSPGTRVKWHERLSLFAAVNAAGGFTELADFRRLRLTRGKVETIHDMRVAGRGFDNPLLLKGDIVHVPKYKPAPKKVR